MFDPVAVKMLTALPLPNLPGYADNWQGRLCREVDYWNLSQRVNVNLTDKWKIFVRYGQFEANLYQQNPTDAGSSRCRAATDTDSAFTATPYYVMLQPDHGEHTQQLLQHDQPVLTLPALLLRDDGLATAL